MSSGFPSPTPADDLPAAPEPHGSDRSSPAPRPVVGAPFADSALAALPTPVVRRSPAGDVALVGVLAAFIAACAVLPPIPTGTAVPITLQTFAITLAGLLLGARRGALAVSLYLVVGLVGVPVLAGGTGGPGVLAGPTVGYLAAFVPATALTGLLAGAARRTRPTRRFWVLAAAGVAATWLVIRPLGIAGLVWRTGMPVHAAFVLDLRFWPGDLAKCLLAAAVAAAALRAFPDLLRDRR